MISYLLNCILNEQQNNRVYAPCGLAGNKQNMSGNNFSYTDQERNAAIAWAEACFAQDDPTRFKALQILERTAVKDAFKREKKSRIVAARSSEQAGLAWFNMINLLPNSRNKNIVIADKVIYFLNMAAGRFYQEITERNDTQKNISLAMCSSYLERIVYVTALSVTVGRYKTFTNEINSIQKINQIMVDKFGAAAAAGSFFKANELAMQRNFSTEVQDLFYQTAVENIKQAFYTTYPSLDLILFYQHYLNNKLEIAMQNGNTTLATQVRQEMEKMSQREMELFEQGHTVANIHSMRDKAPDPHPTLRHRKPKLQ